MKKVFGLIAVAGLATAAVARPAPGLDITFSDDLGATWSDNINVTAGDTVWVSVTMSIPDSYHGISGARYNVTSNAGDWDVGGNDSVSLTPGKGNATDGRLAGFDFGGQTQQIFEASNTLRIDAKGDTGNSAGAGISTAQNTPGALGGAFNTNKVAMVYRFAITTHAAHALNSFMTIKIDDAQITSFKGYVSNTSTSGEAISGAHGDSGRINFVPAPASMALVGLAGLAAGRRRR